jgi:Sec-independent protein translocase protein TatA
MLKYLFWALAIYFLVRFIFNFVIPVYRATRQMRGQMRDFQQKMQGQQGSQESFEQNATSQKEKSSVKEGDYIDFEEIK